MEDVASWDSTALLVLVLVLGIEDDEDDELTFASSG